MVQGEPIIILSIQKLQDPQRANSEVGLQRTPVGFRVRYTEHLSGGLILHMYLVILDKINSITYYNIYNKQGHYYKARYVLNCRVASSKCAARTFYSYIAPTNPPHTTIYVWSAQGCSTPTTNTYCASYCSHLCVSYRWGSVNDFALAFRLS